MPDSAAEDCRIPVAFKTLGCKVNRVESDQIAADLIGRGAVLANEDESAVIVVNTCTVTGEADAKARKAVRQALKARRRPIVVVTGCLAALDARALQAMSDRVIAEPDKSLVAERVAEALGLDDTSDSEGVSGVALGEGFRTRAAIKIEDGCDNFCTYCIVPYARGVPRGVALESIVAQARALGEAGAREIVLTGINVGRYLHGGARLPDVVRAVGATGIERLRLSSVEPPDLDADLLAALAQTPAVCEHLHVPLQSGSDAVLAAMGRTYTSAQYAGFIRAARELIPGLAVTTDVIAGFPGETDADHRATCEFVERIGFAKLHVFRYSERPGTPAAALPQLDSRLKAERATELRALGNSLRAGFVASRSGSTGQVLVESVVRGVATGTTRDYLRVSFPAQSGVAVGELIDVTLTADSCT